MAPGGVRVSLVVMTHVASTSIARPAAEAPEIIVTPPVVTAQVATVVLETARTTPTAAVETPSGSGGGPMGSRRGRRF